ncbi:MAG: efflux RND transporter periplasmic adaptor subunit [Methylococcales bacterium]|nr:efflux RND transporter periplasmic adaptor subunit [Methylococcaceae bacterium]
MSNLELNTNHSADKSKWPRKAIVIGLTLAGFAATAGVIAFAALPKRGVQPDTKPAIPALNVTRTESHRESWSATVEVPGAVAPWQEAVLSAQVAGLRLLEVNAEVGDTVHRGQVVARFDTEMLKADEAQLTAELTKAEANAAQAESNRQRALMLKASGGLSEQDILQNQTQAVTTQAQVDAVKAQLTAKRLQLRYAEVVAPDDGVISSRNATLGSVSNSGQELFRLIRQNRLEWHGELTAAQLAQIKIGQSIQLELPDGSHAAAKVRKISPSLDSQSRLGTLFADLEAGSRARVGMYANGRILLAQSPALVVPAASVVIRDGRSFVVKLKEEKEISAVNLQSVTTGRRQGQDVEILQGLGENEQVVAQGAGFLNDGDLVKVLPSTGSVN